jgi:serine protease Do
MRRTRDWIKFAGLVVLAAVLAVGFMSIIETPEDSMAQSAAPTSLASLPLAQRPVVPAAQPLADLGNAFTAVSEAVRSGVVYIEVESWTDPYHSDSRIPEGMERFFQQQPRRRQGSGSGFIISSDGYIITNNHVVEGADRIDVVLFDQREFEAELVGNDPLTDVAVVKIVGDDLPAVAMGNSDGVNVGEWVLAIGNPLGREYSFTVTAGIVSGRGRRLDNLRPSGEGANWSIHDFIQTDAAINRGNSGGPLVNIRGEVIGVNSAIASETGFYAGYGFAIPINLARNVADQLISYGRVTRAQLGVSIQDVDPELAEYVGLDRIRGVVIQSFSDNSPAEDAGLEPGDVIIELDGREVLYTAQLQQIVGFKRPGESVEVTVLRKQGERHTYEIKLREANTETQQTVAQALPDEDERMGTAEPRLGISVEPFTRELVARYDLDQNAVGLAVTDVDRDGPARGKLNASSPRDGLFEIVTHVNEQRVRSQDDLRDALDGIRPGEVVPVRSLIVQPAGQTSRLVYIRTAGR